MLYCPGLNKRFDERIWKHVRDWEAGDHWNKFRTQ